MYNFFSANFKKKFSNSASAISLLAAVNTGAFMFFSSKALMISTYNGDYRLGVLKGIEDASQHTYNPPSPEFSTDRHINLNVLPAITALSFFATILLIKSTILAKPKDTDILPYNAVRYAGLGLSLFIGITSFTLAFMGQPASSEDPTPYGDAYHKGYQSSCIPNSDPSCIGGVSIPYSGLINSPAIWPLILTGTLTLVSLALMFIAIHLKKAMSEKNTVPNVISMDSIENPEARPFAHHNR